MNSKYSFKSPHFRIQMRFNSNRFSSKTCIAFRILVILYNNILTAYMLILFLNVVHYDIKPSQSRPCAAQNSFVYLR